MMRRKEKEITDRAGIEAVIKEATVCRVAMAVDNQPYIVPLCFGFADNALFFHSATEGKKLEMLRENDRICFEFDIDPAVREGKTGCDWGMNFRSVIGFGRASFIESRESKRAALDAIMGQYSDEVFEFPEKAIEKTIVIKVEIDSMTGKQSD